ncbi:MAG: glycoside hydrolase family 3 C-terminal domain-containing protein [Bacteroidia bacterium]|nr:glycoside hydrolase family 3 C-terminal domain-containing protein [Bacteroidia bacterium]
MKKGLKITLITLGVILAVAIAVGFGFWMFIKSNLLDFEDAYSLKEQPKEITVDGYTFLDRNKNGELDIYEDDRKPIEERVSNLLSLMTPEEKIHLLKGSGMASGSGRLEPGEGIPGAVGTIVPTERLGIPTVYLSDGPAGLRIQPKRKGEDRTYYCTAFPIGTLLASTWNVELVEEIGQAMGNEALEYGIDVVLGPAANIHRHPFCGRNFEYYSEDPVLTGMIGAAMVNGIESNGVGTSVKHFVANNQETERTLNDVLVSDRAMREIYLKGFEIIVKESQPWTIMSSYNKVNGTYTSESKELLTEVLRDDWGFEGLVMTDWFGGKNPPAQISAGNDLLEPGTNKQWKALRKAHKDGELSIEDIDVAAGRILKLILSSKKMQNSSYGNNPDLKSHAKITRNSATEGMTLLKNEDVLPLDEEKNIALIGVTSYDFISGGTGSGDVNEAYSISLEDGLKNAGFEINEKAKSYFEAFKSANEEAFEKPEGFGAIFTPYKPPEMSLEASQLEEIVSSSDIAIVTIGRNSGEGGDRVEVDDFLLSEKEKTLLQNTCEAYHKAGKKVVVVMNIGGVIETASWKSQADGILLAWQGGQEGGNSVADILSGKVSPSGKLPMTFPVKLNDHASNQNFPLDGEPFSLLKLMMGSKEKPKDKQVKNKDYTKYEEGIYVGYRHFDKAGLEVSYPFGFGLSYTSFDYRELEVNTSSDSITVSFSLENTGKLAGKEVVQVYVSKAESNVDRPKMELKAFVKSKKLEVSESVRLSLQIPITDLRYWDEAESKWKLEKGKYMIHLAASSRDSRLTQEIEL